MVRDTISLDSVKRAHEELEELLRQQFEHDQLFHQPHERKGEEAQRPFSSPLGALASTKHSSQSFRSDDRAGSMNSSQRHIEPTLLGSGWSWQMPKDGSDFGHTNSPMEDTAEDHSLGNFATSKEQPWQQLSTDEWLGLKTRMKERQQSPGTPLSKTVILQSQLEEASSVFSESASSSDDGWSSGSDDDLLERNPDFQSLGSVIGRGAFGSVYRLQWKGQPAAVKIIEHEDELGGLQDVQSNHSSLDSNDFDILEGDSMWRNSEKLSTCKLTPSEGISIHTSHADQAMLEAAMSSALHHPNIVQTYHYSTTPADVNGKAMRETRIVMELCDCGSLEDAASDGRLAAAGSTDIDLELLCLTMLEVASAMEYLHKMRITHRDLKLGNVLLKSKPVTEEDPRGFTAKVSDFGLSRLLPDASPKRGAKGEFTGTITHMAPELLEHGGMSRAADAYSFGILMWEALMGESAYEGISKMQVMFGVVSEGLRPSFPANTPSWYSRVATACWRRDPKQRPTFARIAQKLRKQWDVLRFSAD